MHRAKNRSLFLFLKQDSCLGMFESVDTLMSFALRRAPVKPFSEEHQKSATRLYYSSSSLQLKRKEPFEVLNN